MNTFLSYTGAEVDSKLRNMVTNSDVSAQIQAHNESETAHPDIREALENISVTTDATPTEGSTNPVQSGGVYDAFSTFSGAMADALNSVDKVFIAEYGKTTYDELRAYYYQGRILFCYQNVDAMIWLYTVSFFGEGKFTFGSLSRNWIYFVECSQDNEWDSRYYKVSDDDDIQNNSEHIPTSQAVYNALQNLDASNVKFSDGESFQDKLDAGELKGANATINGVNALTLAVESPITLSQSGGTATLGGLTTETWTFELDDGTTVTKSVVVSA